MCCSQQGQKHGKPPPASVTHLCSWCELGYWEHWSLSQKGGRLLAQLVASSATGSLGNGCPACEQRWPPLTSAWKGDTAASPHSQDLLPLQEPPGKGSSALWWVQEGIPRGDSSGVRTSLILSRRHRFYWGLQEGGLDQYLRGTLGTL